MPLPVPHKGEDKKSFISRCISSIYDEYKDVEGRPAAICYSQWAKHKHESKADIVIHAGNNEYPISSEDLGPVDPPSQHNIVVGDNTDPSNDNGKNPFAPHNPAPPAAPFPSNSPPSSTMPDDDDGDNATDDDLNREYIGGSPHLDPEPLPNPEGGALAPNPDNATYTPKGAEDADSLDDHSAKPVISDEQWFLGKKMTFKVDAKTGLARWPLEFHQIEKDFKRPNKVSDHNAEPKHQDNEDSEKVADQEKPYVI